LRLNADNARWHVALADALRDNGDKEGAISQYREALRTPTMPCGTMPSATHLSKEVICGVLWRNSALLTRSVPRVQLIKAITSGCYNGSINDVRIAS
jgi:hypothetical protein